jgi:thiol-disulfide isomerase/thioredoxin
LRAIVLGSSFRLEDMHDFVRRLSVRVASLIDQTSNRANKRRVRISGFLSKPLAAALLLSVAVVLLIACGAAVGSTSNGANPAGDQATNFDFTLYQGKEVLGGSDLNLSQITGKPIVLNFWAGLCPPCRAEMPDFQRFYEEHSDVVTVLGIDVGRFTGLGNEKDAKDLLAELDVTYPVGFTDDASVIPSYRVLGMPTTVFISADGTIFRTWNGILDQEVLEEQTRALLGL